jgi:DNA-binding MarR family transcriptional regulator
LTRLYDERLRPHELSISQFIMLATLIAGGPTTIGVLADRLGIDRTTLSRNVALGLEHQLVATGPGDDARERVVSVTEQGRGRADAALPAWRLAQKEALAGA